MAPLASTPTDRAIETTHQLLGRARAFYRQNKDLPSISPTFRYFTQHPVARLNKKRLRAILKIIAAQQDELHRPLRVMDLACGGGLVAASIASLDNRVLGMDQSREEIELAQKFASGFSDQPLSGFLRFLQVDLIRDSAWEREAEKLLGGPPDVIVLAYALHHLPQLDLFLARLSRWLPPTTILLINEENPHSPTFRLKHWIREWIQKDTEEENHHTYGEWKHLLESHHFRVAPPRGLDLLPGIGHLLGIFQPLLCWSLVFTAMKVADSK